MSIAPIFRFISRRFGWLVFSATVGAIISRAADGPTSPPGPAAATPDQFKLTADVMEAHPPEATARGHARLVSGEWILTADEIQYNYQTAEAVATGHVLVTRPALRVLGETAHYWTKERRVDVTNFRLGQPPYVMSGQRVHGNEDTLVCEHVEIFYGEPGPLTPHASATTITLHRDKTFSADALRFTVGKVPVFALGGVSRTLTLPDLDWESRVGFDSTLGLQVGAGAYLPWQPHFSPGGSLDIFTKRGLMYGPGARYRNTDDDTGATFLRGALDTGFISDHGDTDVDILGRPIDKHRSFATWRHQQKGANWTLNGEMNWWSDSDVIRDFRARDFEHDQEPDNFLEASWYGSNFIASMFARPRPNDFEVVPERLPELRVDLLPTPIADSGVLFEGEASAVALRMKPLGNNDTAGTKSDRLDAYVGLSRTFKVANGATFTPVVGGRWTQYLDATGGRDTYTRMLGEIGFDARMRAFRTWDLAKPLWGISGIRHIIEPYISYRYVPQADRGSSFIPEIDEDNFVPQLQPVGLAGRRDIDQLGEIDVLRIGLTNLVETRRSDYGSRRVLRVDLGTDVHFDDSHEGNRVPDVFAEVLLTPADWLEWWFQMRVDPEQPWVNEFDSRFTLVSGRAWSGGLGVDFLRNDISQYLAFGRYALSESSHLQAAIRYDARAHRWNNIELGIANRIHQNWEVALSVHEREGTRRESGFGVRFDLRFLPF